MRQLQNIGLVHGVSQERFGNNFCPKTVLGLKLIPWLAFIRCQISSFVYYNLITSTHAIYLIIYIKLSKYCVADIITTPN